MAAALRVPVSDSMLRLESERVLESLRFMLVCRLMCSCHRFQLRPPEGECTTGRPRCLPEGQSCQGGPLHRISPSSTSPTRTSLSRVEDILTTLLNRLAQPRPWHCPSVELCSAVHMCGGEFAADERSGSGFSRP